MGYERNADGQLLLNLNKLADENLEDYTRYNSGWIKQVTGLDKKHTDGYSILGEFAQKGLTWHSPGLYLDCSIGGSRKNQERHFTLFFLKPDGTIEPVGPVWRYAGNSGGDWAPHYWPAIETALADLKKGTDEDPTRPIMYALLGAFEDLVQMLRLENTDTLDIQFDDPTAGHVEIKMKVTKTPVNEREVK